MRDKYLYDIESQRERAEKHGCDGKCYTPTSMCPRAETCSETCIGEFWGTIGAIAIIFSVPIGIIAFIIVMLIKLFS